MIPMTEKNVSRMLQIGNTMLSMLKESPQDDLVEEFKRSIKSCMNELSKIKKFDRVVG